jgi:predicted GNAT family acetyltransferase
MIMHGKIAHKIKIAFLFYAHNDRMRTTMIDNAAQNRFELHRPDGHLVYADYAREPGVLVIKYVEAPAALRGTGAAAPLMQEIMEQAKKDGVKVRAVCHYALAWIKRSKDFADMLVD